MSTRNDTSGEALDVSVPVVRLHKEVEHRAVMPDVIGLRRLPSGDISDDPFHRIFACPQPDTGYSKRTF